MRVKVIVQSQQLSKDDLRCLLQMTEILISIKPHYEYGPTIFKTKAVRGER